MITWSTSEAQINSCATHHRKVVITNGGNDSSFGCYDLLEKYNVNKSIRTSVQRQRKVVNSGANELRRKFFLW